MTFREQLLEYMMLVDCTNKELAEASHIGSGTVGRWRTGKTEPDADSELLRRAIDGLCDLAAKKRIPLDREAITRSLTETLHHSASIDYDTYLANLNSLLNQLEIKGGELARNLNFDPSYIYRILSGTRHPADLPQFSSDVASYIVRKYSQGETMEHLASLLQCDVQSLRREKHLYDAIIAWLGSNSRPAEENPIQNFLEKMDSFNLNEYIEVIHFNDIRLPTVPMQFPTTKVYHGIPQMMEAELDFIKATVLSKSMEDCILYSDMPMEEMASDPEFPKKWMMGRAMMLKKGLRLIIIHNVNRPFHEMMLGLEGHIPMYMTGQIAPYYLPQSANDIFLHFLNVSGSAALVGSAIAGYHSQGRYTLTKAKDEVRYYRQQAELLLSRALPLMQIYRSDSQDKFRQYWKKLWQSDHRRMVFGSMPIFTLSEELLLWILHRHNLSECEIQEIMDFWGQYRSHAVTLLREYKISLDVPLLSEEAFHDSPLSLWLSEIYFEKEIVCTYEEYQAHLEQTKAFAAQYQNCSIHLNQTPTFRNISFSVIGSKCVVVSKGKYPAIHFVIHHPKMVQAFRNFIPPLSE